MAALVTAEESPSAVVASLSVAGATASIVLVAVAQLQMAESWRIGVDPDERTELVRSGFYSHIRNPIYTGMAAYAVAHVGLTPSPAAVVAALLMVGGVELQFAQSKSPTSTGCTETQSHWWDRFRAWTWTSGRFVPRVG